MGCSINTVYKDDHKCEHNKNYGKVKSIIVVGSEEFAKDEIKQMLKSHIYSEVVIVDGKLTEDNLISKLKLQNIELVYKPSFEKKQSHKRNYKYHK